MSQSEYVTAYIAAKRAENLRENTITSYHTSLIRFVAWCDARSRPIDELTPADLRAYLRDLLESGMGAPSVSQHRTILLTWLRWLAREGYIDRADWSGVKRVKVDRSKPVYLSQEECRALFAAVRRMPSRSDLVRRRNLALLALMIDTGLRRKELLGLQMVDVDFAARAILVRNTAKNRRERTVYFGAATFRLLRAYLKEREQQYPRSRWLWLSRDGARMSSTQLYDLVRRAGRAAGVVRLFPHALRHTACSLMIQADLPLTYVQQLLGHSDVRTTMLYAHVVEDDLAARFRDASPVDGLGE